MDKLEMKDEFSELYKVMSASSDVRLMRIFGAVMSSMMCDVIDVHPALRRNIYPAFVLSSGAITSRQRKRPV